MELDSNGIGNYYEGDYSASEERLGRALAEMRLGLKKVPKISSMERKILEFCHNRNMKEFLREEFEKHPIRLDENGELIGENPFDKERRELGITEGYYAKDPLFESVRTMETYGDVK